MADYPNSFGKEDLLKCARGELFGPAMRNFPSPDADDGSDHGYFGRWRCATARGTWLPNSTSRQIFGSLTAFPGNPIMPGCLGLDGLWQLTGFNLGWRGGRGAVMRWVLARSS